MSSIQLSSSSTNLIQSKLPNKTEQKTAHFSDQIASLDPQYLASFSMNHYSLFSPIISPMQTGSDELDADAFMLEDTSPPSFAEAPVIGSLTPLSESNPELFEMVSDQLLPCDPAEPDEAYESDELDESYESDESSTSEMDSESSSPLRSQGAAAKRKAEETSPVSEGAGIKRMRFQTRWTPKEDAKLIRLCNSTRNDWKKITSLFKTREEGQLKNHWKVLKKKLN